MKTIKYSIAALFAVILGVNAPAQTHNPSMNMKMTSANTETFKVWGNCEMCKARIEKAAKEEGVSSADWNIETKILTVSFDPAKTNLDAIEKKIADVGHDNEKYRADDKVYNALPDCCKYERAPLNLQSYYTCPMHSEVHSDIPGKCPKCGMDLVVMNADSIGHKHRMMDSMGMMHSDGSKGHVWMYITGVAIMVVMMAVMIL